MNKTFLAVLGPTTLDSSRYQRNSHGGGKDVHPLPAPGNQLQTIALRLQGILRHLRAEIVPSIQQSTLGVGIDSEGGTHESLEAMQVFTEERSGNTAVVYFVHHDARSAAAKLLAHTPGKINALPDSCLLWHNLRTESGDVLSGDREYLAANTHNRLELLSL